MPSIKKMTDTLPEIMRTLEEKLDAVHGERVGVALFVFELGRDDGTNMAYISNSERADMIDAVKRWLSIVERKA